MFGSNRRKFAEIGRLTIVALIALSWVALIWSISGHYAAKRARAETAAAEYSQNADQQIELACATFTGVALRKCIREQVAANRADQRSEYDLTAQQGMADWAFWMVAVSSVTMIIAAFALWFVRETLTETQAMAREARRGTKVGLLAGKAARDSALETRRIGEAQVRCYLSGTTAQLGFTSDGALLVDCNITNTGQSPARSVKTKCKTRFSTQAGLKTLDKRVAAHPIYEVDIAANGEEEITNFIEGGVTDLPPLKTDETLLITLEVKITAFDVFGLPVQETERFKTFVKKLPTANEWITLNRSARIILTS